MSEATRYYRTLRDDPGGRWQKGEIGRAMENDYASKYAVKLFFGNVFGPRIFGDDDADIYEYPRVFYFHEDEVGEIDPRSGIEDDPTGATR